MRLIRWIQGFIKRMKWYDPSLIKLAAVFGILFLITAWTGLRDLLLGVAWYWYLILMVIVSIPLFKRMFFD
ncbi:MAG: hypothetical protein NT001_03975 [Candidatus Woesearchaeota archaeon]|nr:hypothetical protein [Candidatus Woesearchaeota archaeon]